MPTTVAIATSILAASVASAVVATSPVAVTLETPELVSPVAAQQESSSLLTAPVQYTDQVSVQSLEAVTVSLTSFDSPVRSTATLTQLEPGTTELEVLLYGNLDQPVSAHLQLAECGEQLQADSIVPLSAFSEENSSLTRIDADLTQLLTQTQPLSLVLMQENQQLACRQL